MADPEGNEFCVLPAYSPEVRAQWQAQYDAYSEPPHASDGRPGTVASESRRSGDRRRPPRLTPCLTPSAAEAATDG